MHSAADRTCSGSDMMHGVVDKMCDATNMIHGEADILTEWGMVRGQDEYHTPPPPIWKIISCF